MQPVVTGGITLQWTANTADTSYHIYRLTEGVADSGYFTATGNTYQDTSVASSTNYCYYIKGVNDCGHESSPPSATVCAKTPCGAGINFISLTPSAVAVMKGASITFTAVATSGCSGGGAPQLHYSWTVDGVANSTDAATLTLTLPVGGHTIQAAVNDGTNFSGPKSVSVNVYDGLPHSPSPGNLYGDGSNPDDGQNQFPQSPLSPHYEHCQAACDPGADAQGATDVCTDTYTGNTRIRRKDPVYTRGFPIVLDITVNTENILRNRPMGNGTFTYDIFVSHRPVYDGSCNATEHWFVVDGDGTQLDFGPYGTAGSIDPVATQRIFSKLNRVLDSNGNVVNWYLVHAGPPGHIKSYGNFTYFFRGNGQLLQVTDSQGNVQQLVYGGTNGIQLQSITDNSSQKTVTFNYDSGSVFINGVNVGSGLCQNLLSYINGNLVGTNVRNPTSGVVLSSASFDYNSDNTIATLHRSGAAANDIKFAYMPYPSNDCSSGGTMIMPVTISGADSNSRGTFTVYDPVTLGNTTNPGYADTVRIKNPQGGTTVCDYDARLDLRRLTLPAPTGTTTAPVINYTWNSDHELIAVNDGKGAASFTYNSTG